MLLQKEYLRTAERLQVRAALYLSICNESSVEILCVMYLDLLTACRAFRGSEESCEEQDYPAEPSGPERPRGHTRTLSDPTSTDAGHAEQDNMGCTSAPGTHWW